VKSGNLNFLEPSGKLQACNGTALPLAAADLYNTYFLTDPRGSDRVPKSLQTLKKWGVYQEIYHV
jgi:hypothetical protein